MKMLVSAIAIALSAAPAFAQDAKVSGNAANGEKQFVRDGCYQCHNYGGFGSIAGPRIRRTALPFESFLGQLRSPASQMPPYEAAVVSDATARDIYAYLESLPSSPAASSLSVLTNVGKK